VKDPFNSNSLINKTHLANRESHNHFTICCNRGGRSLPTILNNEYPVPTGLHSLMTISTPRQPSHPSPSLKKMEDRKRSAGEDLAPPTTKRQNVNGKNAADADMPWSSDLEVCQGQRHPTCDQFHQSEMFLAQPTLMSARFQIFALDVCHDV
jgi:hypothetical protein